MKKHFICIASVILISACGKTKNGGTPQTITPFTQYLKQNANTSQISIQPNGDTAREIGYTFRVADTGTIYELGLRLPDSSHAYMVSVWDSATQTPLIQKPIQCTGTLAFTYLDLTSTNEAFSIDAQHTYVISFNTVPVGQSRPFGYIFGAADTQFDEFPFVEGPVAYYNQYYTYSGTPAFPAHPIGQSTRALGLVDIGFKYVQ